MKGYCPICKKVIDEVEFSQFGMCVECYKKNKKVKKTSFEFDDPKLYMRFRVWCIEHSITVKAKLTKLIKEVLKD